MIVDAHHHFWDPARHDYPWMGDELASIRRPYGPEDLRPLLLANGVDRSVLVQTIASVEETREFLAIAAATSFLAGVVGWVDLTDASVADRLSQLRDGPGGEWLVGIRHQVHDEADEGWLLRDDVLRGIRAVGEIGLVYELLVRTRELPAALTVARRFPDIRFVLDHMAKPRISRGARDPEWEQAMAGFAELPNVTCKLSGMVTEASWTEWTPEDLEPYVRRVLGWFGPERCIFGSDWPVCLLAASYEQVMQAARYALRGLSNSEIDGVLGSNAIKFYRLAV
ncbi:MAG TPA: amidohydrolase family protein [Candidatus Dormibacteraeota bacterium]|nr:amidohydrolase family protein [Candidatus Dormibacteraeota bacterium]